MTVPANLTDVVAGSGPRPFSYAKVVSLLREKGVRWTIGGSSLFALRAIESWWWDVAHRVSTRRPVSLAHLNLPGTNAPHAVAYEASATACLPRVLTDLDLDCRSFCFVDLGAGKGRTMLLASAFAFRRIVGVELSPSLAEAARRNCVSFTSWRQVCRAFDVVTGDAAEFTFPDGPLVVYMFNPFGAAIVRRVVTNLVASLDASPRDAVLIYHNPLHEDAVEQLADCDVIRRGEDRWDHRSLRYTVFRIRPRAC
jgi:predicted RNA methylase